MILDGRRITVSLATLSAVAVRCPPPHVVLQAIQDGALGPKRGFVKPIGAVIEEDLRFGYHTVAHLLDMTKDIRY